jgi:lathosterol oxidase
MATSTQTWVGPVCQLAQYEGLSFLHYWVLLTLLSFLTLVAFSGSAFYLLYWKPTYASWRYKINPAYPSPDKIREEVLVMLQGLVFSTVCPALSLYFLNNGYGQGYCGLDSTANGGWIWLWKSVFIVWLVTDIYEFLYHYCGHRISSMWTLHKRHHHFYNPTPFAVIADDPIDQFFRAAPLFVLPLLLPINIDMIFTMFSLIFYINGLVQHSGFEIPWLESFGIDGHSGILLTSYHHYLHHAKAAMNKALYNGQFLQIWDWAFGSADPTFRGCVQYTCLCSKCCRNRGERTETHW